VFSIISEIGVPVVLAFEHARQDPHRVGFLRWVVNFDWPGRRASRNGWITPR
jgi:hypothetical protein